MLLWLFAGIEAHVPESMHEALFWVLVVPALLLCVPFTHVLWALGLMQTPGWFAWPKPVGIALVYVAWVAALLAVAALVKSSVSPSPPPSSRSR